MPAQSNDQISQISIGSETIGLALKNLRLEVPVHQRSYKWEADHVTDLYQDLASAMADNQKEYFLGSIVLVLREDGQLEVNDGQQRLATSMILIAAIRDAFLTLLKDERTAILLRPDVAERQAITIKSADLKDSHRRIIRAATIADKFVSDLLAPYKDRPEDQSRELHKWLDYFEKGARVIRVQVGNDRTAYIIFETMNDRGLRLSAADLLKNRLYGMALDRIDEVIERWQR